MQRLREIEATFGTQGMILGAVDTGDMIDDADFAHIDRITRVAATVEGGSVVSPTNLYDLFLEDNTLVERRLYDPGRTALRTCCARICTRRRCFTSCSFPLTARRCSLYFAFPDSDAIDYAANLLSSFF